MKQTNFYLIALLFFTLIACNSDDNDIDLPTVDDITEVQITPTEVVFTEIGQTQEFSAKAYDEDGLEIGAKFTWTSSNTNVVAIRPNGIAQAISPGSADITVTVNEITATAQVVVDLEADPTIWWVAAVDGNWSEASNWSTGAVPSENDKVAIPIEGDYTVTLTNDVSVAYLLLGASEGTQRLATSTNQLTIQDGILKGGAELNIEGSTIIKGKLDWKNGNVTGTGALNINNSAEVMLGNKTESILTISSDVMNNGVMNILPEVTINIDGGSFENMSYARLEMLGDNVAINALNGGVIINSGNIVKSGGIGTSSIHAIGSEGFVNNSHLIVESGMLSLRDGHLNGVIVVEEGAVLRQRGYTFLNQNLIQRGEGVFEIGGNVALGEALGQVITLGNIDLNSNISTNSISGPGDLSVSGFFLWHRGSIQDEGTVFSYGGMRLEGSGIKVLSKKTLVVQGLLETESLLNLELNEGAQVEIDRNGQWIHNGSGTIKQSVGGQSAIKVYDTFTKKGNGSLNVEVDFSCQGIMELKEGELTVKGAFELAETGKLIGGGSNISDPVNYRRLQVPEASSAVLAGTIDLDAAGGQAYMGILGAVTIEPTFKVLVDIKKDDAIPAERLTFETGQVALDGTLAVTIHGNHPPENVEYRVVSTTDATGSFSEITGASWFTNIIQDGSGVLLKR